MTVSEAAVENVNLLLRRVGMGCYIPESNQSKDFYSNLIANLITVDSVQRGRISCKFSVLPILANRYDGLHGGALAAVAERVAIACARTVVTEDNDIFLSELSLSFLVAVPKNEELAVAASVLRSGKTLTVVAMEFRINKSDKLAYTARATFFNMGVAKL